MKVYHKYIFPYIFPLSMEEWFRIEDKPIRQGSNMWKATLKDFEVIGDWLVWKIGIG